MRLPGEVIGALEIALTRMLTQDAAAGDALASLAGRSLVIHVRELDLVLVLRPHTDGIRVDDEPEADPDVRLSGGVRDFARNVFGSGEILGGGIRIEGDVGLAQTFARMLQRADFDFEDWLAERLGDVPAELAGRFARSAWRVLSRAADTLTLDAAEYLREETRDLVHRDEVASFTAEVDRLRAESDRLAARVRRLQSRSGR